jgi:hypothetical protein
MTVKSVIGSVESNFLVKFGPKATTKCRLISHLDAAWFQAMSPALIIVDTSVNIGSISTMFLKLVLHAGAVSSSLHNDNLP